MKVSNNPPSFGMAFKVNAKSLANANPQEIGKVAEVIRQAGQKQLDGASPFVNCLLVAKVQDGKIKGLGVAAISKELKAMFQQIGDGINCLYFGKKIKDISYVKAMTMEELTPTKLLETVKEVSDECLAKFGSTERAKSVLGE